MMVERMAMRTCENASGKNLLVESVLVLSVFVFLVQMVVDS